MSDTTAARVRDALARLRAADEPARAAARNELVNVVYDRYRALATLMLNDFPWLRRAGAESAPVYHDALLRFTQALATVAPEDEAHVRNLIRLQLRRELLDLAEKCRGRVTVGFPQGGTGSDFGAQVPAPASVDPAALVDWTAFHREVERLPERERDVFERIYYEDMSQQEVADDLKCSIQLVKLRYAEAKRTLTERLGDRSVVGPGATP